MPPADSDIYKWISSLGIMMVAYTFSLNLFPIFSSLKVKTTDNMIVTSHAGIWLTFVIYTSTALICLFMFGGTVGGHSNFLE